MSGFGGSGIKITGEKTLRMLVRVFRRGQVNQESVEFDY